MKNIINVLALPVICSSVISCSSAPKTTDAAKEKVSPAEYVSLGSGSFKLQPYKEVVLENGLKVVFIKDTTLPRVSFTLMYKAGSLSEPLKKPGLNALTAYLLEQGTQTRNAIKISDDLGLLGSDIDVSPGYDFTTIYADSLNTGSDFLLDLFADIAMNPAFKDAEINRVKAQMIAGLQKKIDNPSAYADDRMDEFLFNGHPYGRDIRGSISTVRSISKQDIIKHFLAFYRPNNSSLAVVGNFDDQFEARVRTTFGKWAKRTTPTIKTQEPPPINGLKVKLIVKKGLQQTQIRISSFGIPRNNDDYLRLRLANEVLGGGFASRLNQKVRDDLGLTYSIGSYFDARKEKGSFEISTFTKNETAAKTLEETLNVIKSFVAEGAEAKEVEAGRNQLIGQFPRAIETADRLAFNLLALDFYGISVDYLKDFNKNVSEIKPKDANNAFRKIIDPAKLKIIVYGDEKIIPQFEKFKPEIERVK